MRAFVLVTFWRQIIEFSDVDGKQFLYRLVDPQGQRNAAYLLFLHSNSYSLVMVSRVVRVGRSSIA